MQKPYYTPSPPAAYLRAMGFTDRKIAVILGSGLGGLADEMEDAVSVDTSDISGYPVSSVPGHKGRIVAGSLSGVEIFAFQGRVHYYEGYTPLEAVAPVTLVHELGAETVIITNSSGGINPDIAPGGIMLINDFVSFNFINPLRGLTGQEIRGGVLNLDEIAYPPYIEAAKIAAVEVEVNLHVGTYGAVAGPSYETPAEIRMLSFAGADAVGMSTAPEIIMAKHLGMKMLVLSCITNKAAGLSLTPLTHIEVQETADRVSESFKAMMRNLLTKIRLYHKW